MNINYHTVALLSKLRGLLLLGIRISSITRAITKRYSTPFQIVGKAGKTWKTTCSKLHDFYQVASASHV